MDSVASFSPIRITSPQYAEALLSTPRDVGASHQMQNQEEDIYRGVPPSPIRTQPVRPPPSVSSSSSSSGWSGLGLRRGALGAVLELAINRWARSRSDSSTSSASSVSSVHTRLPRRRTRRSSIATGHNIHSENIIRARRKAQEEGRVVPREFVLFLPVTLAPRTVDTSVNHSLSLEQDKRIFHTSSLPLVIAQLDSALKRSAKLRKPKLVKPSSSGKIFESRFNDYMLQEPSPHASRTTIPIDGKGKVPEGPRIFRANGRATPEKPPRKRAWWLDVSSPTWSDMREIGKRLHLHPLTLEDIIHQDPREKLELFPRLGYYFVVFRALESVRPKTCIQIDKSINGFKAVPSMDGALGATNIYIVVFREGICTFHFGDISEHTSRVRNRILQLEETFYFSSDWIAHGILDSMVDQFFPLLNSIEQEAKDLEDLVLSIEGPIRNRGALPDGKTSVTPKVAVDLDLLKGMALEKVEEDSKENAQTQTFSTDELQNFAEPFCYTKPFLWARTRILQFANASPLWILLKQRLHLSQCSQETLTASSPLMRMASTRRLVTSTTRLLSTKSEVVSQIRKRLSGSAVMGSEVGPSEQALAAEVGIYLGDIQDHILSLQQSLAHYERMLSHSHPAYLSHLSVSLAQAKAGMDTALFMLTVLSVSVLAMQTVIGLCSINVNIPRNRRTPSFPGERPAPFNGFIVVVVAVLLVGAGIVSVTRYWWLQAKRRYARRPF
ncbi:hypothetical protein K439DRAFT_1632522 [Ramaria rubella]|nr:hypothetical protein K439DRAFT_1632522 [Ramaria rubella]